MIDSSYAVLLLCGCAERDEAHEDNRPNAYDPFDRPCEEFDAEDDTDTVVDDEGAFDLAAKSSVITADARASPASSLGAEPCGGAEEPVGGVVTFTVCLEATTLEQFDGAARETYAARVAARLGVERARVRVGAARAGSVVVETRVVACAAAELTSLVSRVRQHAQDPRSCSRSPSPWNAATLTTRPTVQ